jgi:hypothetical protein
MRHDQWREVLIPGALVILVLLLEGCCQYPGRCDARPSVSPAGSHQYPTKKYPRGDGRPRRAERTWRELPVLAVNVRRDQAARHLIVTTRTPTDGWTVRVKTVSAAQQGAAEFQIVGLAPAAAAELKSEERTIYREIRLEPGVEHVVVRGSDGSILMDLE